MYSSTCFGRFPVHHHELNDFSGSLWFYLRIVVMVVLCSWSGRPDSQDNKLKNCCIWLVIYLNCTMMHGLTKLKKPGFINSRIFHNKQQKSSLLLKKT
jgi:hypothetical protein